MSTQASGVRLAGYLAPVADEIDAADLPVEGALPTELNGRYLRNGPNPLPGDPRDTGSRGTACCTASG